VLRAVYVDRRLSDFERTIRSIIFSAFGLLGYLAAARGVESLLSRLGWKNFPEWITSPTYLPALGDATAKTTVLLDAKALLPFVLHTLVTSLIALAWGKAIASNRFEKFFVKRTGRSTGGTAWQVLWSRYFPASTAQEVRSVTVVLSSGRRIMGFLQSASNPIEDKDIVLGHPWFWDPTREDWHAENTRFVYIPAGEVEYISLSPAGSETALSGFLRDLNAQRAENRSFEDE
jgi:hypothetical protein